MSLHFAWSVSHSIDLRYIKNPFVSILCLFIGGYVNDAILLVDMKSVPNKTNSVV
jgi:hypothetical protein